MGLTLVQYAANNTEAIQGAFRQDPQALLTNWDVATVPKLAGGAYIVVGGAVYLVDGDEVIGGVAPSANAMYYVKVIPAGATATAEWISAATMATAVYSEANGGWYIGAHLVLPCTVRKVASDHQKLFWSDIRFGENFTIPGQMLAIGAIGSESTLTAGTSLAVGTTASITDKATIDGVVFSGSFTEGSQVILASGNYELPKGIYLTQPDAGLQCQIYRAGAWQNFSTVASDQMLISDGAGGKVRYLNTDGANPHTLYWLQCT